MKWNFCSNYIRKLKRAQILLAADAGVAMSLATRSEISGARSALCGLSKWLTSVRSF